MKKVLCFGELLLRLSPDNNGDWLQQNKLPFYVGGAEANVAAALALWDIPTSYLTVVPDNYLAREITGWLEGLNIDTSKTRYTGERLGLYYLGQDKDLKSAGVIYDRSHSSFAGLKPGMIDWENIFKEISWFHFSAICPALNGDLADVCEEAVRAASELGVQISIDLNYRAKLWQYGKRPDEIMPRLVSYCNLVMGNIWAADKMLDIRLPEDIPAQSSREIYLEQAEKSSAEIMASYPRCTGVANTFRFEHNGAINYYTTLYTGNKMLVSKEYNAEKVVNKIGSGDCFMAGLIYAGLNRMQDQEGLDFATAAAFAKLFTETDFSKATVAEINKLASNE